MISLKISPPNPPTLGGTRLKSPNLVGIKEDTYLFFLPPELGGRGGETLMSS